MIIAVQRCSGEVKQTQYLIFKSFKKRKGAETKYRRLLQFIFIYFLRRKTDAASVPRIEAINTASDFEQPLLPPSPS